MKNTYKADSVNTAHTIEIICAECGHDLATDELSDITCTACGGELTLRQNIAVTVNALPSMSNLTS